MSSPANRGVQEHLDASHPIAIGQEVAVLALGPFGPFCEGTARIVARGEGSHHYAVRFDGEPTTTASERFVHPAYQSDPEGALGWMTLLWVASLRPVLDDIFPIGMSRQKGGLQNGRA